MNSLSKKCQVVLIYSFWSVLRICLGQESSSDENLSAESDFNCSDSNGISSTDEEAAPTEPLWLKATRIVLTTAALFGLLGFFLHRYRVKNASRFHYRPYSPPRGQRERKRSGATIQFEEIMRVKREQERREKEERMHRSRIYKIRERMRQWQIEQQQAKDKVRISVEAPTPITDGVSAPGRGSVVATGLKGLLGEMAVYPNIPPVEDTSILPPKS